jgi:hypothetical protein
VPKSFLPTFRDAADIYVRDVLPTKAPRTQVDNLKELVFLREFFDADARLGEIEPVHIKQYLRWRHQKTRAWYKEKNRPAPATSARTARLLCSVTSSTAPAKAA